MNRLKDCVGAKPQILKAVGGCGALSGCQTSMPCETLNPIRSEWLREWLRNPQTQKGVGGCETLNPKRTEWLRNPHTLKEVGGCQTPKP